MLARFKTLFKKGESKENCLNSLNGLKYSKKHFYQEGGFIFEKKTKKIKAPAKS